MKHILLSLLTLHSSLFTLSAAVPLRWTVETSRLAPAVFDVVRGETIALEAAFNSAGKPFAMDSEPVSVFWQTNGMGSAWWTASAVATSNLVRATFTPEMDPGATTVNGFLGSSGSIYRAAFTFRFRHGPGAVPNTLPLPVPVIDFAKVRVLNPPWSGGGGVDTNAVIDIIHKTVDGAARTLPPYLHFLEMDDTYPEAAAEWYSGERASRPFSCSAVRSGGFLYRNFDYPFDDRAEFVVKMSAGKDRFASVGVAQVGTNLTEQIVTSGKWSKWYKALPCATVDGINENGVVAEINVVDGDPQTSGWHNTGDLHPLAAVRWVLDNATNALQAATYIASHIAFPQGWTQNFHYMIADERDEFIVENGQIEISIPGERKVLTNFNILRYPRAGMGLERFNLLASGANITNAWYTNAYRRETTPPWVSDLAEVIDYTNEIFNAWASHPKEYFRNKTNGGESWWQTVHTSVYDITNRVLRIAVQETDDWYVFAVPSAGGVKQEAVREIVEPMIEAHHDDTKLDKTAPGEGPVGSVSWKDEHTLKTEQAGIEINGGSLYVHGIIMANIWSDFSTDNDTGRTLPAYLDSLAWRTTGDRTLSQYGITDGATKTELSAKQDALPYPTNAIPASVITGLEPPTSPTLRVYDEVRLCWWIGRMVNGVINWEVE